MNILLAQFDASVLNIGTFDLAVLAAAVAIAIYVGLRLAGRQESVEAYLLGNRNLPWWAILGSIVATETSTATVLSLPGHGYGPVGMKFLQIAMGYVVGRALVVHWLLPQFFMGKLFSAYEVLKLRFGAAATYAASALFLVTRNLGDGLRLFLAALVLQKMVGWSFAFSAITIGAVTIVYTYLGGMRSVVWNDCIQLVIYMLGGVATVFVIASMLPGGWTTFWEFAEATGKLQVFALTPPAGSDTRWWRWLLTDAYSFWAGLIGGAALTLGTHGTDQMMVQRYLSARCQRDAARAIILSALVVLVQFALFLFVGVQLACYYEQFPEIEFSRADEVYAHFIVHHFPRNTGLVGLMLAAILAAAMSTLSSSLNASAAAVVNDFYLPLSRKRPSEKRLLVVSRSLTALFGCIQVAIGIWAVTFSQAVVDNALTIAGFSAGTLLGLFLLAVFTRRATVSDALLGGAGGLVVLSLIQFGLPYWGWRIAWPWYALIAASATCSIGWLLSLRHQLVPEH